MPTLTSVHKVTKPHRIVKHLPRRLDTKAVRIRLIERGWNMMELARRAKLARPYVSQIVHGRICRPRAQARIERVLGMGNGNRSDQANRSNRSNDGKKKSGKEKE